MIILSDNSNAQTVLKGKTLRVYRFIINQKNPARVRDMQRKLGFSSPSLVIYHLEKLKEEGLIKEEGLGYVPDKVLLKNLIRFKNALIPRYFFYFLFFSMGLVIELTVFRPVIINKEYFIALTFTALATIVFAFEAHSNWRGL